MKNFDKGKVKAIKMKVAPKWADFLQDPKTKPKPSGRKVEDIQKFAAAVVLKAIHNALEDGGKNVVEGDDIETNVVSSGIIVTLTRDSSGEYTLACTGAGWPPNANMTFDETGL